VTFFCQVLEEAFRPDTVLVSVMTVNNEIGVKQPIEQIGMCYYAFNVILHLCGVRASIRPSHLCHSTLRCLVAFSGCVTKGSNDNYTCARNWHKKSVPENVI